MTLTYYKGYPIDDIWGFKQARLLTERKMFIYGSIDPEEARTSAEITDDYHQMLMDDSKTPIHVFIMSGGGSAYGGLHLYDLFTQSPCPIYTYAQGIVASAATLVFLAGTKRFIAPHAWMMFHETSSFAYGKLSEREDDISQEKLLGQQFVEIYADNSNLSIEEIQERVYRRNWWFDANQAVEYGFAHQIGWKNE